MRLCSRFKFSIRDFVELEFCKIVNFEIGKILIDKFQFFQKSQNPLFSDSKVTILISPNTQIKKYKKTVLDGLEPSTFRLTAECSTY